MDGNLPEELMENIISFLPVKSLLRFTTISKSWECIITGHRFVVTHFRQANSSPQNLFMIPSYIGRIMGKLIRLENQKVYYLDLKYPSEISEGYVEICYSNGLILAHYGDNKGRMYVVWNPSTRVCVKFECPYEFSWKNDFHGLCYDPLEGDCKVVIWDRKKYAVFNCKSNHWTDVKDISKFMNGFSYAIQYRGRGVPSSNGDYYWPAFAKRNAKRKVKIICFDSKEVKFKTLPKLPITQRPDLRFASLRFSSAGNHLVVHRFLSKGGGWMFVETFELKMDDGQYYWKKLNMHFATTRPGGSKRMVHMESEKEILLIGPRIHPKVPVYALYNYEGQRLIEIETSSDFMLNRSYIFVPFPENLFCFK